MKNTDKIINGTIAALLIASTVNPVYAFEVETSVEEVIVDLEEVIVEDIVVEMDPVEDTIIVEEELIPDVSIEVGEAWKPNKPNTTRPVQDVVVESDPVGETIIVEEDLIVEIDPVEDTVIYEEGEDLIVEADTAEPEIFEEVITEPVPEVGAVVGEVWTPNKPNATRPAQLEAVCNVVNKTQNNILSVLNKLKFKR